MPISRSRSAEVSNRFLYRTNIAIRVATSYKFLSNVPALGSLNGIFQNSHSKMKRRSIT